MDLTLEIEKWLVLTRVAVLQPLDRHFFDSCSARDLFKSFVAGGRNLSDMKGKYATLIKVSAYQAI